MSSDSHLTTIENISSPFTGAAEAFATRSCDFYRAQLENFPLPLWSAGADGSCDYCNAEWLAFTGRALPQEVGAGWLQAVHLDDCDGIRQVIADAVRLEQSFSTQYRLQRQDGVYCLVRHEANVLRDADKKFVGFVGALLDLSEQTQAEAQWNRVQALKQIEAALRESEERYALAARAANEGLWDWDLRTDAIYFSPRWKEMLGLNENAVCDAPEAWFGRVHPEDIENLRAAIAGHRAGESLHLECEYRMLHTDETYHWMRSRGLAVRDENRVAYRMAGSQSDITERKQVEEQLRHNTLHDALTGLPNRVLFSERLTRAMERAKRYDDYLIAVLFLDFDHFKVINDSLGHFVGDQMLQSVAQRLQDCVRGNDTVARMGGDEFTILLDDIKDSGDAVDAAQRIQSAMKVPFELAGNTIHSDVSIGIALSRISPSQSYDTPEEILRDADTAMYRAKNMGRGRYEIFDKTMHAQAMKRAQMENELRRAIENREFLLHYQPIVDLISGEISGFETLVRWQHPQRGTISPDEFIPLAEETGMIVSLDHWVLHEACRQRRAWEDALNGGATSAGAINKSAILSKGASEMPPLTISVNWSSRHFSRPETIEHIERVLNETGVAASSLKIEIRENVLMEGNDAVNQTLQNLREMGIQLSMDDFGTGYSSLSYLHRFPLDTLKIDRSFISPALPGKANQNGSSVETNRDISAHNLEIVRAIIALARNLKVNVVAEGVETPGQMEQLRDMECEYGQGHFFAAPVDSQAAQKMLTRPRRW